MFVSEKTHKYNHFLIVTSELIKQANMLWYNGDMVHEKFYVNSLFHLFNLPFSWNNSFKPWFKETAGLVILLENQRLYDYIVQSIALYTVHHTSNVAIFLSCVRHAYLPYCWGKHSEMFPAGVRSILHSSKSVELWTEVKVNDKTDHKKEFSLQ